MRLCCCVSVYSTLYHYDEWLICQRLVSDMKNSVERLRHIDWKFAMYLNLKNVLKENYQLCLSIDMANENVGHKKEDIICDINQLSLNNSETDWYSFSLRVFLVAA